MKLHEIHDERPLIAELIGRRLMAGDEVFMATKAIHGKIISMIDNRCDYLPTGETSLKNSSWFEFNGGEHDSDDQILDLVKNRPGVWHVVERKGKEFKL